MYLDTIHLHAKTLDTILDIAEFVLKCDLLIDAVFGHSVH